MSGLRWERSPAQLADEVERYGERVLAATKLAAETIGQWMQEYAQVNAPWTDRTGNARRGLTSAVIYSGTGIEIMLYHTEEYGIYLEVCNGGKYRIIVPTIIEFGPLYWAVMKAVIGA